MSVKSQNPHGSLKQWKIGSPQTATAVPVKKGKKAKKSKKVRTLTKEEEEMKQWVEEMSKQLHQNIGPSTFEETTEKIKDKVENYNASYPFKKHLIDFKK